MGIGKHVVQCTPEFEGWSAKKENVPDSLRSTRRSYGADRVQCQRRKSAAATSATAVTTKASPRKGAVSASSQVGGRNQNQRPAPHITTALSPKAMSIKRWGAASMGGASPGCKAFWGSRKSTDTAHLPPVLPTHHLTKASMSLKAGCSQLRSHSKATISVVTNSAPAPARRS